MWKTETSIDNIVSHSPAVQVLSAYIPNVFIHFYLLVKLNCVLILQIPAGQTALMMQVREMIQIMMIMKPVKMMRRKIAERDRLRDLDL